MEIKLDFIEGRLLAITPNNISILTEISHKIDSSYRNAFSGSDKNTARNLIITYGQEDKYGWTTNKKYVQRVCEAIDKENATHLYVSGVRKKRKKQNKGLEMMVKCITNQNNLLKQIEEGDLSVVDIISRAVNGVSKLSFASKFCSYVARYQFNSDAYSIYDNVIQGILPYYFLKYCKRELAVKYVGKKYSTISYKRHKDEDNYYKTYNGLIGELLKSIKVKDNLTVSREQLDTVLWYYYKGDSDLVNKAISIVVVAKYS